MRVEVFTVMKIHAFLFWLMAPFSLVAYRRFGKTLFPSSLLFSLWGMILFTHFLIV